MSILPGLMTLPIRLQSDGPLGLQLLGRPLPERRFRFTATPASIPARNLDQPSTRREHGILKPLALPVSFGEAAPIHVAVNTTVQLPGDGPVRAHPRRDHSRPARSPGRPAMACAQWHPSPARRGHFPNRSSQLSVRDTPATPQRWWPGGRLFWPSGSRRVQPQQPSA